MSKKADLTEITTTTETTDITETAETTENLTFKVGDQTSNFTIKKSEYIPELAYSGGTADKKSAAYEMQHKSGAKLLFIENDDPEKSFTIGFKTPPKDSTGVFHILEHSVLCGSKKFPVKEPFVNLLKTSMYTFLNAITFEDKTMYPVASTNEKDLYNLAEVYLDAVFFPNLYKNKNIFYQEGGHKTVDDNNTLGFNGVVFNEMTGAYSEPEWVAYKKAKELLLPGSCYSHDSGGNPDDIKNLTYEEFLLEHARHYQLSNSYIVVYGDLDIHKMLEFLDTKYLDKEEEIIQWAKNGLPDVDFSTLKPRNIEPVEASTGSFEQHKMVTSPENSVSIWCYLIPKDREKILATALLLDAIADTNESPLKADLLAKNFAKDITLEVSSSKLQPMVTVACKGVVPGISDKIDKYVAESLEKVLSGGINTRLLEAALSRTEFLFKEEIAEESPGIDKAILVLGDWLYNDDHSIISLKYQEALDNLKNKLNTNYFETLAEEIFLNNKNKAGVEIVPVDSLQQEKPEKVDDTTADRIRKICEELKAQQEAPDEPHNVAKLPKLKKSDIGKIREFPKIMEIDNNNSSNNNCAGRKIKAYKYDAKTNGITYANRYYPLESLYFDDLPYVTILCSVLGKLDTSDHSAAEINTRITNMLGELTFMCIPFAQDKDVNNVDLRLAVRASALDKNASQLTYLVDEILRGTLFDDYDKIKSILQQKKLMLEQCFIMAGHQFATSRAQSYILPGCVAGEFISGVDFYTFLTNLLADFDNQFANLCTKLQNLSDEIFSKPPTTTLIGSDDFCKKYLKNLQKFTDAGNDAGNDAGKTKTTTERINTATETTSNMKIPAPIIRNEAFVIPANVCYDALVNNYQIAGMEMASKGAVAVTSGIITLDYLWNEVRVKGGAYGVSLRNTQKGSMCFSSYRDPNMARTFDKFVQSTKWLQEADFSEDALNGFIISKVAKIDAPMPVKLIMRFQDANILCETDPAEREKTRKEILDMTPEKIKQTAKELQTLAEDGVRCVFGSAEIIKDSDMRIVNLLS